jgi:hypothetical protein
MNKPDLSPANVTHRVIAVLSALAVLSMFADPGVARALDSVNPHLSTVVNALGVVGLFCTKELVSIKALARAFRVLGPADDNSDVPTR